MVFKHPIQMLQNDIDNIFSIIIDPINEKMKIVNKPTKNKINLSLKNLSKNLHDRTQFEINKQQRKETEDTVSISGETIKSKDDT